MSQRALHSFIEAWANVLIGFGISVLANYLILPFYGVPPSVKTSLEIGIWFTLISFIRSYFLRRAFNWLHTHTSWK
jgi:hypothetical protein